MNYEEAWNRVADGERFEDPDILGLTDSLGWTVAHSQARWGGVILNPDILSLKSGGGLTVLDIMLEKGWEPQTEEEKLLVFTVKAGL